MEEKIENTLRIEPDTGAVVINDTLRIDPEWTFEEIVNSEAYKRYAYIEVIDEIRSFLIDNVAGNQMIIDVSLRDAKIKRIEIKFLHNSQGESERKQESDFIALREILYNSFLGYNSDDNSDGYVLYKFPWGSAVCNINRREFFSDIYISFRRA